MHRDILPQSHYDTINYLLERLNEPSLDKATQEQLLNELQATLDNGVKFTLEQRESHLNNIKTTQERI